MDFFLEQHPEFRGREVRSYADLRYFQGEVSKHIGMKLVRVNPPGYWYTKDYERVWHRSNFTRAGIEKTLPIFHEELTEWANMQLNGWNRIWDCGQNVWVLT